MRGKGVREVGRRERVLQDARGGRRCVVPGCDTSAKLRGLCQKHGGGSMCQIDRCERGAKVRNLCSEHGGSKRCSVPGCEKLDRGRGFCQKHGELVGVGPPRCAAPFWSTGGGGGAWPAGARRSPGRKWRPVCCTPKERRRECKLYFHFFIKYTISTLQSCISAPSPSARSPPSSLRLPSAV